MRFASPARLWQNDSRTIRFESILMPLSLRVFGTLALTLLGLARPVAAAPDFAAWLVELRGEALNQGIRTETLDLALQGLAPNPRVIELDRKQPEFTLTFDQYRERVVPPTRIERGRRLLARHAALLKEVAARYHVQPRFIVALWGIETDFGRVTGGFSVIEALATLAYDGRRSAYFRKELLYALRIIDEGHVTPENMVGSWAGAMGQSQFMPSSFVRYAIDYSGDGRRDIWGTLADVFASAANYLAKAGWRDDQTWGREVRLPSGFDTGLADIKVIRKISAWQALGVRRADGRDLPRRDLDASIVLPGGPDGPAYMVYNNYRSLLKWNRSTYFATAVGLLSDAIARR